MTDLNTRLAEVVRADPDLMHVLTTVRGLGLDDWRVFSGAVYQCVWNAVTGRPVGYGRKDYDLGYFDPDTSWDAEDAVIKRVAAAFDEPFRSEVEVRNQARVHLWFMDRFGEPYEPLTGTDEADDTISIAAPFGLEDVFSMTLRPNPDRPLARGWDKTVASARSRWPELTVIAPEPA